jgi:hypothetical protein
MSKSQPKKSQSRSRKAKHAVKDLAPKADQQIKAGTVITNLANMRQEVRKAVAANLVS